LQPQPQAYQQPRVREIPVIHESSSRRTPPRSEPMQTNTGARQIPIRQIPVQHEGSPARSTGSRGSTPTRGMPAHMQSEWAGRAGSPGSRFVDVPIQVEGRASPGTHGYTPYPQQPQQSQTDGGNVRQIPIRHMGTEQAQQPAPAQPQHQATPPPAQGNNHQAPPQITVPSAQSTPPPQAAAAPQPQGGANLSTPERQPHGRSPSPAPPNLTPLEHIAAIHEEQGTLRSSVESFTGTKKDKQYKYMEEMLTRLLIKLDRIDSEGKDEIRTARKQAVRDVQATLDQLELKGFANEAPEPANAPTADAANNVPNSQPNQQNSQTKPMDTKNSSGKPDPSHVKEMSLDSEINC